MSFPAVICFAQLQNLSLWTAYDESLFQRMVDGIFSCIALLGGGPVIRFQRGSNICQRLAAAVQHRIDESRSFALQMQTQESGTYCCARRAAAALAICTFLQSILSFPAVCRSAGFSRGLSKYRGR